MKSTVRKRKAYASAGVDIDLGNRLKRRIQRFVRQTHGPEVLLSFRAKRSAVENTPGGAPADGLRVGITTWEE